MIKQTIGPKIGSIIIVILLFMIAVLCLAPIIHVIALSLSNSSSVMAGYVTLFPVDITLSSYRILALRPDFFVSFRMSLFRVLLGLMVNMTIILITAYPLSKGNSEFRGRTAYAWYLIITIIFYGGLIPTYMIVSKVGLVDSIWALILPGAVPVWNIVLMLNFFRNLPKEIEESAFIDGANHFIVLRKLYIPLSMPAIATIALFTIVNHWNSWFDGLIYLNSPSMYPLQTFLYMVGASVTLGSTTTENVEYMREISDKTIRSAQIVLAMIPVLIAYPFLQKYFTKGIVMGSVKG